MGGCVSTPDNKVNPPSNDKIIHVEPRYNHYSKPDFSKHERSEGKPVETSASNDNVIEVKPPDGSLRKHGRSLEDIKSAAPGTNIIHGRFPEGHDASNDEKFQANTLETCLENANNALVFKDTINGRSSEKIEHEGREESNRVSSKVLYGLPPKSVRFDIDFNETNINSRSTPRKFPRRLKVRNRRDDDFRYFYGLMYTLFTRSFRMKET